MIHAVLVLRDRRPPIDPDHPLGDTVETFVRLEDAERFVDEVRSDDPELAGYLRVEERELEVGGRGLGVRSSFMHVRCSGRCRPCSSGGLSDRQERVAKLAAPTSAARRLRGVRFGLWG